MSKSKQQQQQQQKPKQKPKQERWEKERKPVKMGGKESREFKSDLQLTFTVRAWAVLTQVVRRSGKNEVSGFGISSIDDPLRVEDFKLVGQEVGGASTDMDDDALNMYLAQMAQAGIEPHRCMRIWIHTHPFSLSTTPSPSGTDEHTLLEVLGEADWAVMVIVGKARSPEKVYAESLVRVPGMKRRLRVSLGVKVLWETILTKEEVQVLEEEFDSKVKEKPPAVVPVVSAGPEVEPLARGSHFLFPHGGKKESNILPNTTFWSDWLRDIKNVDGTIGWKEYKKCRYEGFTAAEMILYGRLATKCTPEQLRKSRYGKHRR
jgi:hypothetical protein